MSINFENPGNFSGSADASKANALKNPKVIGAIADPLGRPGLDTWLHFPGIIRACR